MGEKKRILVFRGGSDQEVALMVVPPGLTWFPEEGGGMGGLDGVLQGLFIEAELPLPQETLLRGLGSISLGT